MSKYTYNDIMSVFKWAQKNPKSNIEEWFDWNSENISKEELDYFKDVKFFKFEIGKTNFMLLSIDTFKIENFIQKFAGNKPFISWHPMPGEYYENLCVITFDDIDMKEWNNFKSFKDAKFSSDNKKRITFITESDENKFYENMKKLEREKIRLWDSTGQGSALNVFINRESKFDFKPIKELFKEV